MILTIFKKDLKLFFGDKKGMFLTFLIPIILIALFAFAFGGNGGGKNKANPIKLLIVDLDQSNDSKRVISRLDSLNEVTLIPKDSSEATSLVIKGKYIGVLIFKNGFEKAINTGKRLPLELKYDAAREIEMSMLRGILIQNLTSVIGKKSVKVKMNSYFNENFPEMLPAVKEKIFNDVESSEAGISGTMNADLELEITSVIKEESKKGNLGLIQAVAGTAIMMLLFSITGIGGGLLDEKEAGTLKRLLYSPLRTTDILFGKMGAALVLAILQLLVMFLFSWAVFGLPIFKDVSALVLMILATAFAVSSFGMLLVAIANTRQQLQGYSTLVIFLMSAIGGSMVPIFIMPAFMQKIAILSVNYWGIQGFYDIFWRNLGIIDMLPKMGVLVGIGLVMSIISVQLFKKNIFKLVYG